MDRRIYLHIRPYISTLSSLEWTAVIALCIRLTIHFSCWSSSSCTRNLDSLAEEIVQSSCFGCLVWVWVHSVYYDYYYFAVSKYRFELDYQNKLETQPRSLRRLALFEWCFGQLGKKRGLGWWTKMFITHHWYSSINGRPKKDTKPTLIMKYVDLWRRTDFSGGGHYLTIPSAIKQVSEMASIVQCCPVLLEMGRRRRQSVSSHRNNPLPNSENSPAECWCLLACFGLWRRCFSQQQRRFGHDDEDDWCYHLPQLCFSSSKCGWRVTQTHNLRLLICFFLALRPQSRSK